MEHRLPRPAVRASVGRRHALAALRHRDFRLLWLGQLLSTTGTVMQEVTVAWHVYLLTDSPLQVGLLGLFRVVAVLAIALVGGAIADLVSRKRVLRASQTTLLALAAALGLATASGAATPWLIYGVTLLTAATLAFDTPARQALVPSTVPREELPAALTLQTLVRQTATVVGPGIGGLVLAQLGLAATYGLASACYLGMLVALLRIGPTPEARAQSGGLAMALGGLRYARREPIVLLTYCLDFAVTCLVQTLTLIPIFARDVLAVGPLGLGLLHAASASGALVGGAVLGLLGGPHRPVPMMLAAYAARGLFVVGFGQAPDLAVAVLMLFCVGASDVVSEVSAQTVVQLKTPDEVRGRVMAFGMLFTWNGPYLGQMQSGLVASLVGPRSAAALGGLGGLVVALLFSQFPSLRRGGAEVRVR